MQQPPSGTVTFLFTDIEGSTKLWESDADAMSEALERHDEIVRASIEAHGGHVFKTIGDAFCAAFATAPNALGAALEAQQSLFAEPWRIERPLRARMALHTGAVQERGGDYFGQPVNRVARLLAAGHGGQTLLSAAAQELVRDALPAGCSLIDLGDASLKDLARPEHVYQLRHAHLPSEFAALRVLTSPELPNNLPQQATSFIGREQELEAIEALLGKGEGKIKKRLLSLVGPGGAGKTRLALQAAADLLGGDGDGVWLVELAPLSVPSLVPGAAAQVLGVKEAGGEPIQLTLVNALKAKNLLIILDNCEHVLDACCSLANDLIRTCPGVHILATSREPLGAPGEQVYRVPSLSVPNQPADKAGAPLVTAESLSAFDSVRLFIDRAKAVQPGFAVTDQNAPAVAQVCSTLDGIPLAIELAAARVRSLSVEEVNARLTQRFRLLTGGSRAALPRQQTLKALIDWSYDLLSGEEKNLLVCLSVFAGGWTLAAAETVGASDGDSGAGALEEWQILDLLTSLTDKSLVAHSEPEAGAGAAVSRYRMLETVRQYGQDRLAEGSEDEARATRRRHADWCAALAEEAEPQLKGAEQARWLAALEAEHDNLRAALSWYEQEQGTGGAAPLLRLSASLQKFWDVRGYYAEGRHWLNRALDSSGTPAADAAALLPYRAKALGALGTLAFSQGDYAVARERYEESLALLRGLSDPAGVAHILMSLGGVARNLGDYPAARALLEESLAISRQSSDEQTAASALINLGNVEYSQGDLTRARAHYQESGEISRRTGHLRTAAIALGNVGIMAFEMGDHAAGVALMREKLDIHRQLGDQKGMASALLNLGMAARLEGDLARARELHRESLEISRATGDQEMIVQAVEENAGATAAGNPARAVRLWGAMDVLRRRIGLIINPAEQQSRDDGFAALRERLGGAAYEAAWSTGRAMTTEQAVEYALTGSD